MSEHTGDRGQAIEELVIIAGAKDRHYWGDLWRCRELLVMLAWRDIAVRYKQTVAGATWVILQPLCTMLVLTLVFGMLAALPSQGGAPYSVMVFVAMLPWQFFATAINSASQSVVANAGLISKVYFPRLAIPISVLGVAFVDTLVSCLTLGALMAWHGIMPGPRIMLVPVLLLLTALCALGPALVLTALTVRYRDFRFILPFVVQVGLYLSPVAYTSSLVRERFGETAFIAYSINPMVGVVDAFRWAVLPQAGLFPGMQLAIGSVVAAIFMIAGVRYFRAAERIFADVI